MRKYIYIGVLFLFCSGRASAQFTLVSGTVTDANGVAYACGTLSAGIVNVNGQSLYLNGVQFSPNPSATKLGCPSDPTTSHTSGAFSLQLADNTQIKCGSGASIITCATQTQWLFTVNTTGIAPPAGTGPQVCTALLTISGASQAVTFPNCAALALSNIATAPGGSNGQVQYNNNGAFAGAASATINPAGNYLTINGAFGGNSALSVVNTSGSRQLSVGTGGSNFFIDSNGGLNSVNILTTLNNCSSSASPAVCGSAIAGSVAITAAATTETVNTTAVTANSQIILTRDDSLGSKLGVTCNTATVMGEMKVSARTAGTSFTITVQTAPAVNPGCVSYWIVN